jgi:NDP-sugar pyrophosphorylase family protein
LVINADVLSDLDLSRFLDEHVASGAIFTIGATSRDQVLDYGVLGVEGERLVDFREKPKLAQLVSMGIYAVNRRVLGYIPSSGPFGFDQLMLKLIEMGEPVNVKTHSGYWLDIGRPDDYERATIEFEKDRKRFL